MEENTEKAFETVNSRRTGAPWRHAARGARAALGAAGRLIFPLETYCLCCGNFVDETREYCLCDHCVRRIGWGHVEIDLESEARQLGRESYLDSARACAGYGLYSRRLIFDLKYNGNTYVARVLGKILFDRIKTDSGAVDALMGADFVVPVPIHRKKLRERGFNQTEKMGKYFVKHMAEEQSAQGLMATRLYGAALKRVRETAAQRSITGEERYFNLFDAFAVPEAAKGKLEGSHVILVDDVYTTGATAHICAKVMKEAGVQRVDLLTLATGNDFASGFFGVSELNE